MFQFAALVRIGWKSDRFPAPKLYCLKGNRILIIFRNYEFLNRRQKAERDFDQPKADVRSCRSSAASFEVIERPPFMVRKSGFMIFDA